MSVTLANAKSAVVSLASVALEGAPSFVENGLRERRMRQRQREEEDVIGSRILQVPTRRYATLSRVAKRTLDLVVSVILLIALAPLLVVLKMLFHFFNPGPVFYKQIRMGHGGTPFVLYKLRTMTVDADKHRDLLMHQNEQSGPMFKIERDPRITPVGRFLRRYSIDELPQLWNVLRGDMSLVGPRPSLPDEVRKFRMWQAERLAVKPGLTCIWQVSGRNRIGFEEWMRMDLRYLNDWNLWLDVRLLARTVKVVLLADGAA